MLGHPKWSQEISQSPWLPATQISGKSYLSQRPQHPDPSSPSILISLFLLRIKAIREGSPFNPPDPFFTPTPNPTSLISHTALGEILLSPDLIWPLRSRPQAMEAQCSHNTSGRVQPQPRIARGNNLRSSVLPSWPLARPPLPKAVISSQGSHSPESEDEKVEEISKALWP